MDRELGESPMEKKQKVRRPSDRDVVWKREQSPCINKERAALRVAFGLNIASGCPLDSPIFGTHVPKGIEQTGCWRTGNELEECLKCLHIPEDFYKLVIGNMHSTSTSVISLHFRIPAREARCSSCGNDPSCVEERITGTVEILFCTSFKATSFKESYGPVCTWHKL